MNIFTEEKLHKICSNFEHITVKKNGYGFEHNLDLHHDICVVVESGGSAASFGRQRVVGGSGSGHLFVKVLNLLFVHLHHNRPLQLHGRACRVQSLGYIPGFKCAQME